MKQLPNLLTLSRILVIPGIIAVFYWDHPQTNWMAFGLFAVAGFTDFFDGGGTTRYNFHYLWCLYAIVWGIQKYDEAKV